MRSVVGAYRAGGGGDGRGIEVDNTRGRSLRTGVQCSPQRSVSRALLPTQRWSQAFARHRLRRHQQLCVAGG